MNQLVTGPSEAEQKMAMLQQVSQQNDLNCVMGNFDQAWGDSQKMAMEEMTREQQLMMCQWAQAQMQEQQMMQELQMKEAQMNGQFDLAQEHEMCENWQTEFVEEQDQFK